MRRAAKVDVNQAEIVAALRAVGASVELLHRVGGGCPDLLVGFRGVNYVLEVKRVVGVRKKRRTKLNAAQVLWHATWRGQKAVVATAADALVAIGACESEAA